MAESSWHRCDMKKLRHCHPMYNVLLQYMTLPIPNNMALHQAAEKISGLSVEVIKLMLNYMYKTLVILNISIIEIVSITNYTCS